MSTAIKNQIEHKENMKNCVKYLRSLADDIEANDVVVDISLGEEKERFGMREKTDVITVLRIFTTKKEEDKIGS